MTLRRGSGQGQTLGSTIDPDVRVRPLGRRKPEGLYQRALGEGQAKTLGSTYDPDIY